MVEKTGDNTFILITVAVLSVLVVALLIAYSFTSYVPPTPYFSTTVPANLSTAVAPNLASCDGFNFSLSAASKTSSGSCTWRGGLMNVTIDGGNFANTAVYLRQINSTQPFSSTYYGTSCLSNSTAYYIPVGNYNVSFSTGSLSQLNGRCGSAMMRLSKA